MKCPNQMMTHKITEHPCEKTWPDTTNSRTFIRMMNGLQLTTGKSSLTFINFLFYLLLFLVKEKQKSKIVGAQHFEFSIMSPIFNFQCNFCDLMFIYAPFDWSISVTWYIILPVVWLMKSFNAYFSSSTSSSQNLPSCKYL